jgi:hypothetical protein
MVCAYLAIRARVKPKRALVWSTGEMTARRSVSHASDDAAAVHAWIAWGELRQSDTADISTSRRPGAVF